MIPAVRNYSHSSLTSRDLAMTFSTIFRSCFMGLCLVFEPSISSSAKKRNRRGSSLNSLFSRTVKEVRIKPCPVFRPQVRNKTRQGVLLWENMRPECEAELLLPPRSFIFLFPYFPLTAHPEAFYSFYRLVCNL